MRLFVSLLLFVCPFSALLAQPQSAPSDTSMIQEIYQLVDQRNAKSEVFDRALTSKDEKILGIALLGLGRIGGEVAVTAVKPFITHRSEKVRQVAALALGLSAEPTANLQLWKQLKAEKSPLVRTEIYLALGNLGQNGLVTQMLTQLANENNADARSALFQGLAIALTFHRDLKDDFSKIDFNRVLTIFAKGGQQDAMAGYFLSRVPQVGDYITEQDLLNLSKAPLSLQARAYLAKLIGKVSVNQSTANRDLLIWLIEQSNSEFLSVKLEATRAIGQFLNSPQALIQIGKLGASEHPVVAHTALEVIVDSELHDEKVIKLFKSHLKNDNDAMVISAARGLIKRQKKDEMSWIVSLFKHPSSYVKINLISILKNKSETEFSNLIKFFTQDPNKKVAQYAKQQLEAPVETKTQQAESPSYASAIKAANKKLRFKTTQGDFTIRLLAEAPFTAWHFLNNAKQGVFTESYFSRVIGNFVAQGGDTIGDREGSSNRAIREEINFFNHEPMTLGMATSGKDTGTSQFFINTARNPHLDRNYTIFAQVISGQEAIMRMTNGAKVLSVEVME